MDNPQHDAAMETSQKDSRVTTSTDCKRVAGDVVDGDNRSNKKVCTNPSYIDLIASFIQQREKMHASPTLTPVNNMKSYTEVASLSVFKDSKGYGCGSRYYGLYSMDLNYERELIVNGGAYGITVYNKPAHLLNPLLAHSQRVYGVKFTPKADFVVSGSADEMVCIWKNLTGYERNPSMYKVCCTLNDHTDEVRAITIDAKGESFVSASLDKTWRCYNFDSEKCVVKVGETTDTESDGYTSAAFYPSGKLLGTGTLGAQVKIWDLKNELIVDKFEGHMGPITALAFSQNGYHFATAARNGFKLWDLRNSRSYISNLIVNNQEILLNDALDFDDSGRYLAIGGSAIGIYDVASVESPILTIPYYFPNLGSAKGIKFGPDAKYIVVGTMDSKIRIYGMPGSINLEQ